MYVNANVRLPTVKIRHRSTGKTMVINQSDWSGDLGVSVYAGWERVGAEKHNGSDDTKLVISTSSDNEEVKPKRRRPGRPKLEKM